MKRTSRWRARMPVSDFFARGRSHPAFRSTIPHTPLAPTSKHTRRGTPHTGLRAAGRTDGRTDDGKESAKVERESAAAAAAAHSQLRIIRIPSGRPTAKAAPPRPVRRVPPSPAAAASLVQIMFLRGRAAINFNYLGIDFCSSN